MSTEATEKRSKAKASASDASGAQQKTKMVQFINVSKHFAGTTAVDDVTMTSFSGTVNAVTGENGAGKSTLMKMLSGVHHPDEGEIKLDGKPFHPKNPKEAQLLGVSTIFQELNLISNLSVAENLFFGHEPTKFGMVDRKTLEKNAKDLLNQFGLDINPKRPTGSLTIAEQQFIEIAKGVSHDAKVYIFDEPTAALNSAETERLFELIEKLRSQNKLIYYISHRLDEIFRLSDKISVMKDGVLTAEFQRGETDEAGLIRAMVGRDLGDYFPSRPTLKDAPIKMNIKDLEPQGDRHVVKFAVRKGEIVGLAGLEGQGQREIIRALVGLDHPDQADVILDGKPLPCKKGIVATVQDGLGFVPEDRKTEGLFLTESIKKNMELGQIRDARLFSFAKNNKEEILKVSQKMRLKATSDAQKVGSLSGGNQQKVMLGRWLISGVDVMVIEEPTRGVDVGAKAEIYSALRNYCSEGHSILITSSELTELIGLCDRILVVREGAIVAEIAGEDASEEKILAYAIQSGNQNSESAMSHAKGEV